MHGVRKDRGAFKGSLSPENMERQAERKGEAGVPVGRPWKRRGRTRAEAKGRGVLGPRRPDRMARGWSGWHWASPCSHSGIWLHWVPAATPPEPLLTAIVSSIAPLLGSGPAQTMCEPSGEIDWAPEDTFWKCP